MPVRPCVKYHSQEEGSVKLTIHHIARRYNVSPCLRLCQRLLYQHLHRLVYGHGGQEIEDTVVDVVQLAASRWSQLLILPLH